MKILEFLAFNRKASKWICFGVFFALYCVLMETSLRDWICMFFCALPITAVFMLADYAPSILQYKALVALNDECDPFPLLKISEKLLQKGVSMLVKYEVTINYCVALRYIGEYEKVYSILTGLDAESLPRKSIIKLYICNNLSDTCIQLEKFDESIEYAKKCKETYASLSNTKLKSQLSYIENTLQMDILYAEGKYEEALGLRDAIPKKIIKNEVDLAIYCAKIYLKLGDIENARKKLDFVISRGNRLFAVVEAKRMLERISSDSI